MRSAILAMVLAGCTPKLEYWTVGANEVAWQAPARPRLASDGTCKVTLRVRVVDERGAPVAGAELIVRRSEHIAAPSTVHTDVVYQTEAVRTNARGEAMTCSPDDVPGTDNLFGDTRSREVLARHGDRKGSVQGPFVTTPVVVVR